MSKFVFNVTLAGTLDSSKVVSVVLESKDGLYGMRNRATGEVVIAAGTPMTNTSAGVWEYDYSAAPLYDPRYYYDYVMKITQDDGDVFYGIGLLPQGNLVSTPTTLSGYARTYGELAEKVGRNLDDPFHERYTEETIIRELNFGFAELAIETGIISETIVVQMLAGQTDYNIKALAELAGLRDYVMAQRIAINGTELPGLLPTSQGVIDALMLAVGYDGRPTKWMAAMADYGTIKVWGTPSSDGDAPPLLNGNISVTYKSLPYYIDDSTLYPDYGIPPSMYEAAVKHATREILLREEDTAAMEKAIGFSKGYLSDLSLGMADINASGHADTDMEPL